MSKFIEFIKSDRFKTIVAVVAAVVMYFTPDPVDAIITAGLGALGISSLVLSVKSKE